MHTFFQGVKSCIKQPTSTEALMFLQKTSNALKIAFLIYLLQITIHIF